MQRKISTKPSKRVSSKKSPAPRTYRSAAAKAVHETARDLFDIGLVAPRTMRDLDKFCLTPIKHFEPRDIEALRKRESASQAVFAHHLGLSTNIISQWERGEKKPRGASLKLLTLVEKNGLDWVA